MTDDQQEQEQQSSEKEEGKGATEGQLGLEPHVEFEVTDPND